MTARTLLAAACAMSAFACATDEPQALGTLEVSWSTGPTDCATAGIASVVIELDGATMREASCGDGQATIEDLEIGSRSLVLLGVDADGVERYAAPPRTVTLVEDGVASADDMVLSALPARVDVTWYFTNGRLCSTNDIVDVQVSIWRDGFLEADVTTPCDDGAAGIGGLTSGAFLVAVQGLGKNGAVRTEGSSELVLDKGDRVVLEVPLAVDEAPR